MMAAEMKHHHWPYECEDEQVSHRDPQREGGKKTERDFISKQTTFFICY